MLFALGFVAPLRSYGPQAKLHRKLESGEAKASNAPGFLGRFLPKPFGKSRNAANKSADAGRKSRSKLPF